MLWGRDAPRASSLSHLASGMVRTLSYSDGVCDIMPHILSLESLGYSCAVERMLTVVRDDGLPVAAQAAVGNSATAAEAPVFEAMYSTISIVVG